MNANARSQRRRSMQLVSVGDHHAADGGATFPRNHGASSRTDVMFGDGNLVSRALAGNRGEPETTRGKEYQWSSRTCTL